MRILLIAGQVLMAGVLLGGGTAALAAEPQPLIGQAEQVYALAAENTEVRGLAFAEAGSDPARLYVLDQSARVFVYPLGDDSDLPLEPMEPMEIVDLAAAAGGARLNGIRGLALAIEAGHPVLYFLNWDSAGGIRSELWRYDVAESTAACVDLTLYMFRLGDRETLDLASTGDGLLISFDATGYTDQNLRVQRGILRLAFDGTFSENTVRARHLPDAGTSAANGVAWMNWDGAEYLWATIGNEQVYCADGPTGRGLFFFDRPKSTVDSQGCRGLCFGRDALWVSEQLPGPDRVLRVNVTKNLDSHYEGPRVLRRLVMSIQTDPAGDSPDPGAVFHYYSRPYDYEQLLSQGIWPETETLVDLSAAPNAVLKQVIHDPGGDVASRQILPSVEYASAPARSYASQYEIDLWTSPYRKFVYPHRVNDCLDGIAGADYLADDPMLYNLDDVDTYSAFIQRVRQHIGNKYGVAAEMQNAYWAARNVVEYLQDNYYYPSPVKRIPATVDYDRQHYDANPANLKIELSSRPYDKTQIIACSGTSVMVAGAMRHLGMPARWLGTGTPAAGGWDTDGDGLLDPDETATCSNGHRYTQVWQGSRYGWICFDATPSKPDRNDYDPPPPLQSQWRYMERAANGHRIDNRIVFNVGSEFLLPLYRDFQYDAALAIDNNCGGDQRYNLQGRCEKPEFWKRARHSIRVKNVCFISNVTLSGPAESTQVAWRLDGPWDRLPEATLSIEVQELAAPHKSARLAAGIRCDANTASVDLSGFRGKQCRLILRRDGDPATGGCSEPFALE